MEAAATRTTGKTRTGGRLFCLREACGHILYRMVSGTGKLFRNRVMAEVEGCPSRNKVAPCALVVDGNSRARKTICRWLTRAGFHCGQAAGPREALVRLQDQESHLLTLDIGVPDRSGLETLSEIKQRWPDTEVLVLTALEETTTAIEAMTLGAYGYLLKPIESGELVFHAKKALERRRLIVERRQYTATLEAKVREQMQAVRRAHEETILRLLSASRYRDEETGAHISAQACTASCSPRSWAGRPTRCRTSAWPRPCTTWARSAFRTPSCKNPTSSRPKNSRS